jgi:hypothetical protein
MRRFLGALPLALLGAACGLRPWTPSVSVAFWAEDVPAGRQVSLPRSDELSRAWTLPQDNPWSRYGKMTLTSAVDAMGDVAYLPDVRSLAVVSDAEAAAVAVARAGLPDGTLWVVDMRGAASCAFASALSRESVAPVAPVITFNNWPAEDGVVPADETLAGLLAFVPKLPPAAAPSTHPVFVLDSWRLAYRMDDPGDQVYDNRYILNATDLPDRDTLRAQGITRVVYVVEDVDDAEVEEDDLNASFRAWQAAGVSIYMVDLAFLMKGDWRGDWTVRLRPEQVVVSQRYTLIDDPFFYARARVGFGLARGRPIIVPGAYGSRGAGYGSGGSGG